MYNNNNPISHTSMKANTFTRIFFSALLAVMTQTALCAVDVPEYRFHSTGTLMSRPTPVIVSTPAVSFSPAKTSGSAFRLYSTSSSSVSVAGVAGGSSASYSGGGSGRASSINYSGGSYSISLPALSISRTSVASQIAASLDEAESEKQGVRRIAPPVPDGNPTPVGDAPWMMLILMMAGYTLYRRRVRE